tara:strand:- start:1 stop:480 length:480 start_codon:yes stop_codon:yes gene_type:complete
MIDLRKASLGIGFIEVMTATVIISIACVGLMMGVVHARGELHSLEMKERATEELLNYMEYWKGRVADGNLSPTERAGDPDGEEIYLIGGLNQKNSVKAKRYYKLRRLNGFNDFGSTDFTRYELQCWMKWGDRFLSPSSRYSSDLMHERRISTIMTVFEL